LPLVTRDNSRRVFLLGVAGLVPAALVTLLFIHQPAIGGRRLYPLLRLPLTATAFTLALATVIAWARSPVRLKRPSLSGLAWAAVAVLLCIGPFVESNPRDRLFALELDNGDVEWATSRAAVHPRLVDGELIVDEVDAGAAIWLDPRTGEELRRVENFAPDPPDAGDDRLAIVDGRVEAAGDDGHDGWTREFVGERVLAVVASGDRAFAYVSTPRADDDAAGAADEARIEGASIVQLDLDDGSEGWRRVLDDSVASDEPALAASDERVVVAGGEEIAVLDADSGVEDWSESVVALGKSRGYALPEADHELLVSDEHGLVFLSVTPAA
jgi:outer membrane protein assembly factor BamB